MSTASLTVRLLIATVTMFVTVGIAALGVMVLEPFAADLSAVATVGIATTTIGGAKQ